MSRYSLASALLFQVPTEGNFAEPGKIYVASSDWRDRRRSTLPLSQAASQPRRTSTASALLMLLVSLKLRGRGHALRLRRAIAASKTGRKVRTSSQLNRTAGGALSEKYHAPLIVRDLALVAHREVGGDDAARAVENAGARVHLPAIAPWVRLWSALGPIMPLPSVLKVKPLPLPKLITPDSVSVPSSLGIMSELNEAAPPEIASIVASGLEPPIDVVIALACPVVFASSTRSEPALGPADPRARIT